MTSRTRPPRSLISRIIDSMRDDTLAGVVLLAAVVVAMTWANSPLKDSYHTLSDVQLGPGALGLNMSLAHWAADGVLAIFFFVVGLELKNEFVVGALRNVRTALLPMLAAVFGMVVPALIFAGVQIATGSGHLQGWAIPTATDIAFAIALLGLLGKGMPPGVRVFLMTLAVIDDLLAIIVIAVFYSSGLNFLALAGSFAAVAVFAVLVNKRITHWWLLIPLGVLAWALMFSSGVHATIAGVLLGMTFPAKPTRREPHGMAHEMADRITPLSNGIVLPVFAFFASGVTIEGGVGMLGHPVALGVILGLVAGKVLGIFGGVALLVRFTPLRLTGGVDLPDILATSFLAGIGFTVSLLIAGLSFGGSEVESTAKLAVVAGSVFSAALAAIALRLRVATKVRGHGDFQ